MNNFYPKVSIVIPVYNGSNYMCEAIDSALAQTYNNLEIIVVNDGSSDGGETERIALSYENKIKYYVKENGGVATALNLGIEKMTGDYFSWLSHDDRYLPDKIEAQVEHINKTGEHDAIIYTDYDFIDAEGELLESIQLPKIEPRQMCFYLLTAQAIHGCTLMIPKKAFAMAGTFPEDLPTTQDYTLFLRLTDHCMFFHCPKVLVQGRQHDQQGCRTMDHQEEVHGYYCRELKRLSPEKMAAMFRPDEIGDAWVKLAQHFKLIGFPDCFEMVCENALMNMGAHEQEKFKESLKQQDKESLKQQDSENNKLLTCRVNLMQKTKNIIKRILPEYVLDLYRNQVEIKQTDLLRSEPSDSKIDLFLNLSTVCNYNCIFCNRDVEKKYIRINEIKNLDELLTHARSVDITGYGEITYHPDFEETIKLLSRKKIPIRFVTNGSRLNEKYVDLLIKSEISEIVISVNSLNSKTYSKLHRANANLETTLNNIEYLVSCRPTFPVRLSFVITAYNIQEIPEFIKYAKGRVSSIDCLGLTPTLKQRYPDNLLVENNIDNRNYLDSMRELAKREGVTAGIFKLDNQSTKDKSIDPVRLKEIIKTCDWVNSKFFVEQDGQVGPCCWSNVRLGNIKEKNFNEIWHGEKYELLRKEVKAGRSTFCKNCRRIG